MKILTFLVGLLSLPFGLYAVSARHSSDSLNRQDKDPLYLQWMMGVNKSTNENMPWTEFSRYTWAFGTFIAIGKEITPLWGWRIATRYNYNKSRNTESCESWDSWGWSDLELMGDVTFDFTNALKKTNTQTCRGWNVKGFVGAGGAYTFGFPKEIPLSYTYPYSKDSRLLPAVRAGVTVSYILNEQWGVTSELSHTLVTDGFNGVVDHKIPIDGRSNLKVGVVYYPNRPKAKKKRGPITYAPRLHDIPALPLMIPVAEENKVRRIAGRAFLDFPVNETAIYTDYRRNPEELTRIHASMDSAMFDQSIVVTKIVLHGYASPEGTFANNERLSKGRVMALKNYLMQKYGIKDEAFEVENTPEDWQNLRDFIAQGDRRTVKDGSWYKTTETSETPETPETVIASREELLAVIDSEKDLDEKEALLKQVGNGEPYAWLKQYVYPGLRHTDYVIEYSVGHFETKDSRRLIYTHPEALSLNEMYQVANSYPLGSDGWYDALMMAAKMFPNDETANLNAACACVHFKRLKSAKEYLDKAGDSEDVGYVRSVIDAMEGKVKWSLDENRNLIIHK